MRRKQFSARTWPAPFFPLVHFQIPATSKSLNNFSEIEIFLFYFFALHSPPPGGLSLLTRVDSRGDFGTFGPHLLALLLQNPGWWDWFVWPVQFFACPTYVLLSVHDSLRNLIDGTCFTWLNAALILSLLRYVVSVMYLHCISITLRYLTLPMCQWVFALCADCWCMNCKSWVIESVILA